MFLIDTQNKSATPLEKKSFAELKLNERQDLQEWIAGNPEILGENLLIIQKEFDEFPDTNERLDLLALDESGRLVIIENKLDDSGKDVVWQALKYASYCATLKKSEICDIYQRFLGSEGDAAEKISDFFDEPDYESIKLNPENGGQRIMLVAANFRKEVTSTVLWLTERGIDITCIKVTPYMDGEKLYLDVERILPVQDIDDYRIRLTEKKREEVKSSNEEALRYKTRRRFWSRALPVLREKTGLFGNVSPTKNHYITAPSGRAGISFVPTITRNNSRIDLYLDVGDKEKNKLIYSRLAEKKDGIESAFGESLDWHELRDKRASVITFNYRDHGLKDEEHWDEIISFMANNLKKLMEVFKEPIELAARN